MKKGNSQDIDIAATFATGRAPALLGNVLAEGARLVAAGEVPADVVAEKGGCYALCLLARDRDEVRGLRGGDAVTVGRARAGAATDWHVDDKWLSKAHFRVAVDADGIPRAEDLESLNGTFVNDRRIGAPAPLMRGDCIRAGHSVFIVL